VWTSVFESIKSRAGKKFYTKTHAVAMTGGLSQLTIALSMPQNLEKTEILPSHVLEASSREGEVGTESYANHQNELSWLPEIVRNIAMMSPRRDNGRAILNIGAAFVAMCGLILLIGLISLCFGFQTAMLLLVLFVFSAIMLVVYSIHAGFVCNSGLCDSTPLPDRGFNLIPESQNPLILWIVDVVPYVLFFFLVVVSSSRNLIIVSLLVLFALRIVVVAATGLPSPRQGHMAESGLVSHLYDSFRIDTHQPVQGFTDMIFSGHVGTLVLSMLWLAELYPRPGGFVIAILVSALYGASVIACRYHYTVDVLLGSAIAALVFMVIRARYPRKNLR